MIDVAISNLRYADQTGTLIDMDVSIDGAEPIQFTYAANDSAPVAVAVRAVLAAGAHEIAPYAAPPVDLTAYAADARWRHETGGATWSGWPIHTDATSQTKYLAELQAIEIGARTDGDGWKFADGIFRPVSNADFAALATAARAHVRACFAAEAAVLADIAAGTIATTAEVDAAFAAL